jgi:YggT family protein
LREVQVQLLLGVFWLINEVLTLYWWAVILAAVMSNLFAFGVLDRRNRLVWNIGEFLYQITEPLLRPIRRFLPTFGSVDVSPIVLLLLITFVQRFVLTQIEQVVLGGMMGGL